MIKHLSVEEILIIHYKVMERFNDKEQAGVMNKEALLSAALRPQAKYFGEELFPSIWDKAGALTQSLLQEHPFYNGNKRTAFACLGMFLKKNGYTLKMPPKKAAEMMVSFVTEERFKIDGAKEIGKEIRKLLKKTPA